MTTFLVYATNQVAAEAGIIKSSSGRPRITCQHLPNRGDALWKLGSEQVSILGAYPQFASL